MARGSCRFRHGLGQFRHRAPDPGAQGTLSQVTYLEAIGAALADALRDDERVFLIGEDIGHFGGAFGVTKGLWEEFGDERVIDTPIS